MQTPNYLLALYPGTRRLGWRKSSFFSLACQVPGYEAIYLHDVHLSLSGILWYPALSDLLGGQPAGTELCQWHVLAAQEKLPWGGRRSVCLFRVPCRGLLHWEGLVVKVRAVIFQHTSLINWSGTPLICDQSEVISIWSLEILSPLRWQLFAGILLASYFNSQLIIFMRVY